MKEFFSLLNLCTLLLAILMIVYVTRTIKKNEMKWGRHIALSFILGLIICIIAASRDHYGSDNAIITFTGIEATIFSILGGLVFILTISSILIKKINYRRFVFISISIVFVLKFVLMEVIRLL